LQEIARKALLNHDGWSSVGLASKADVSRVAHGLGVAEINMVNYGLKTKKKDFCFTDEVVCGLEKKVYLLNE